MASIFDYVAYDSIATGVQGEFKGRFETIHDLLKTQLPDNRYSKQAEIYLEIAYAFVGKAIRDDQIDRNGYAPLQEGRNDTAGPKPSGIDTPYKKQRSRIAESQARLAQEISKSSIVPERFKTTIKVPEHLIEELQKTVSDPAFKEATIARPLNEIVELIRNSDLKNIEVKEDYGAKEGNLVSVFKDGKIVKSLSLKDGMDTRAIAVQFVRDVLAELKRDEMILSSSSNKESNSGEVNEFFAFAKGLLKTRPYITFDIGIRPDQKGPYYIQAYEIPPGRDRYFAKELEADTIDDLRAQLIQWVNLYDSVIKEHPPTSEDVYYPDYDALASEAAKKCVPLGGNQTETGFDIIRFTTKSVDDSLARVDDAIASLSLEQLDKRIKEIEIDCAAIRRRRKQVEVAENIRRVNEEARVKSMGDRLRAKNAAPKIEKSWLKRVSETLFGTGAP